MKIYLASYFEPENHGPGRKIGISPSKPKDLEETKGYECQYRYLFLSPEDIYWDYHKERRSAQDDKEKLAQAGKNFEKSYRDRLSDFEQQVRAVSEATGKTVFEVIELEDGDTLLSWENNGHMTFRSITAECLRSLGYETQEE
jgi:hypothetical protein